MKRIEKAALTLTRYLALKAKRDRLFYWSDARLLPLRSVEILPSLYYRWLFNLCMKMAEVRTLERVADKVVHHIPLKIRFELA